MSAFIVSPVAILRIATYILNDPYLRDRFNHDFLPESGEEESEGDHLCRILHNLNCEAVDQRYSEKNGREKMTFTPTHPAGGSTFSLYKTLRCYLYQCSEGDVPETKLYKFVERAAGHLAHDIITKIPAYDQAEWG